jgi:hypothetical protein
MRRTRPLGVAFVVVVGLVALIVVVAKQFYPPQVPVIQASPTSTERLVPVNTDVPLPVPTGTPLLLATNTPVALPTARTPGEAIAPFPDAPLCPDSGELHDNSLFHTLWDSVRGSVYIAGGGHLPRL